MIALISDLHFQDTVATGPVRNNSNVARGAFAHFWRNIEMLAERARVRDGITVVLNGDTLELLRSERWFANRARPYNFTSGRPDDAAIATAVEIAEALLVENAEGISALARPGARFVYVYGNHDRLLRLEAMAPVREKLSRLLGGKVEFCDEFLDERHQLVARHGHELDWTNSEYQVGRAFDHISPLDVDRRDHSAFGDWIAIDLGARLPHLAWEMLQSQPEKWAPLHEQARKELYERLIDLDDLRPPGEVLTWLTRPASLTAQREGEDLGPKVAEFTSALMNELVHQATPHIEPWFDAHQRPLVDRLALGALEFLGSSRYLASTVPALMERVRTYVAENEKPWLLVPQLPEWNDGRYRFFASGHTHAPMVVPLRRDAPRPGAPAWYLNTGTWRKTVIKSALDLHAFDTLKQLSFVTVYDRAETEQTAGVAETSFDFWHGLTRRF